MSVPSRACARVHGGAAGRRWGSWCAVTLGTVAFGCGWLSPVPPPTSRPAPPEAPSEASPDVPPPAILSAHLSRVDDPELDGDDGLLVVFTTDLDAMTVDAGAFVVSRADDGPVRPKRALLSPASEDDENRSVWLIGDFGGAAPEQAPSHVAVSGPLFAEDGTPLRGLGATVTPFTTAPAVVATHWLPAGPGRCEGAGGLLRTYWSAALRGVEPDDLERVTLGLADGGSVHPSGFDDHAREHDEAGQDNVLDLCVGPDPPVQPAHRLRIDAGAFRDVAGHDNDAIDLATVPPEA